MANVITELGHADKKKNQAYRWVFTLNNYSEDDLKQVDDLAAVCKWLIFGKEVAPTTGTPHLQGAFVLVKQMRLRAVSRMLRRASLRVMRGTPQQCKVYCSKDGDVTEHGVCPVDKTEQRSLREVAADAFAMDIGEAVKMLERDAPAQMLIGGTRIKAYLRDRVPAYKGKRDVIWLWGKYGEGKTRYAREVLGAKLASYSAKGGFFAFEPGAQAVVFNEVDKETSRLPIDKWLQICDYGYDDDVVEVKNGWQPWTPGTVIFTSTKMPEEVYPMAGDEGGQVERRITQCINVFNGWFNFD